MVDKAPEQPEKKADNPREAGVKPQLEDWRERKEKAIGEIKDAYNKAKRKIRTPLADFQEKVLKQVVTLPLNKLEDDVEVAIMAGKGEILAQDKAEEFEKRRKKAIDMAVSYINKMATDVGLNAEAVSRMVEDQNRKASRFADLLISGKYPKIEQAMLFALGSQGESSSLPDAGKKAEETILAYLKSDLDKPNSEVMDYIWTIFSFMDHDSRMSITKAYLKDKSADQTNAFLNLGNARGVFKWDEIKELNPGKKYSEEEVKNQQRNWQAQNDYKAQAIALGMVPYGTENVVGKTINIRNAIMLFVKFGAGATVLGNFITGAWQGGKFRGFGEAVKRITNPQSLTAIGLYAGIKVLESDKTIDQLLYGNKDKQEAATNLRKQKNGNPKWAAWDNFFRGGKDFEGGQVFFNYVQNLKKIYDTTDLSKISDHLTPGNFSDFLGRMAAKKNSDNINYATLKESFAKINPEEIMTFAKIFDTLNIGGKNGKDEYERYLNAPEHA